MTDSLRHMEEQYEGLEHEFLRYEEVYVHFIYSFSWDISKTSWEDLRRDLVSRGGAGGPGRSGTKGWQERQLHERTLGDTSENSVTPNYQPNLVTKSTVLEMEGTIGSGTTLLVPVEQYTGVTLKECRKLPVDLSYTVRLSDNGGGTCTFLARLRDAVASFENIHLAIHLAHNVDLGDEPVVAHCHLTNTFIQIPRKSKSRTDHSPFPQNKDESYTFEEGYCSLHDLFRRLLTHLHKWAPPDPFFYDEEVIRMGNVRQDFQSPFLFTVAQVERNSFLRFGKTPTLNSAKEVGSILCKLTLDNRSVTTDYLHLSEDYIREVLPFSEERGGLTNLCLDGRLFFMFSRRGAVALTADLKGIPACFVVPSLLNLCEVLRARWHLGNVVNIKLDEAIARASRANGVSPSDILEGVFKWRALFGLFFRDPVPFLFDGGSITEIAEIAANQLWLNKMSQEIYTKFEALDRIVQDLYARKRVEDLARWSGETR